MTTPFIELNIDNWTLIGGKDDPVAHKRFTTAVKNIRKVLDNMTEKRLLKLPETHPDWGLTIDEVREDYTKED